MGTRGRIGVLRPDGRVESIYNHYDSYIGDDDSGGLGKTLYNRFRDQNLIDEIIKLGNRKGLYDDDDYKEAEYLFNEPSRFDKSEDDFWDNDADWDEGIEYKYLYKPNDKGGEWFVGDNWDYPDPTPLSDFFPKPKEVNVGGRFPSHKKNTFKTASDLADNIIKKEI